MNNYKIDSFKTLSFPVIALSLLIGFFADIKCINWALVYGGFVSEGVMNLLYPVVISLILFFSLFPSVRKYKTKRVFHFVFCATLLIFYFLTDAFCGSPRSPLFLFCALTLFAFVVPNMCIVDTRLVLKSMMIYPCFAILRIDMVFRTVTEWQDYVNMDASYGFLIPVVANIVYMLYYFKEENRKGKVVTIAFSLVNLAYLMRLLVNGSRGVVLSIVLFTFFVWIAKIKENGGIGWNTSRITIGTILIIVLAFSYITFFSMLNDLLISNFGYKFYAIDKIVRLGNEENLSNGRDVVSSVCFNGFLESPIWGNGIDRFGPNTQMAYPHNFILQILYDGGLCFFFFLFIPLYRSIKQKLEVIQRDEMVLLVSFFFSAVPGALFSQDMYGIPLLWMTFGFILSSGFIKERRKFQSL